MPQLSQQPAHTEALFTSSLPRLSKSFVRQERNAEMMQHFGLWKANRRLLACDHNGEGLASWRWTLHSAGTISTLGSWQAARARITLRPSLSHLHSLAIARLSHAYLRSSTSSRLGRRQQSGLDDLEWRKNAIRVHRPRDAAAASRLARIALRGSCFEGPILH